MAEIINSRDILHGEIVWETSLHAALDPVMEVATNELSVYNKKVLASIFSHQALGGSQHKAVTATTNGFMTPALVQKLYDMDAKYQEVRDQFRQYIPRYSGVITMYHRKAPGFTPTGWEQKEILQDFVAGATYNIANYPDLGTTNIKIVSEDNNNASIVYIKNVGSDPADYPFEYLVPDDFEGENLFCIDRDNDTRIKLFISNDSEVYGDYVNDSGSGPFELDENNDIMMKEEGEQVEDEYWVLDGDDYTGISIALDVPPSSAIL